MKFSSFFFSTKKSVDDWKNRRKQKQKEKIQSSISLNKTEEEGEEEENDGKLLNENIQEHLIICSSNYKQPQQTLKRFFFSK